MIKGLEGLHFKQQDPLHSLTKDFESPWSDDVASLVQSRG